MLWQLAKEDMNKTSLAGRQAVQPRSSTCAGEGNNSLQVLGKLDTLLDGGSQLGDQGGQPLLLVGAQVAQGVDGVHACGQQLRASIPKAALQLC